MLTSNIAPALDMGYAKKVQPKEDTCIFLIYESLRYHCQMGGLPYGVLSIGVIRF